MKGLKNICGRSEKHGCLSLRYLRPIFLVVLTGIVASIQGQLNSMYTEKIFLHTDREYYISGEELQFSAWLLAGDKSEVRSRILYVELRESRSGSGDSRTFRIDHNPVSGSLHLSDSLKSGSYILSAYTNWHRNFGNRYAFRKELIVINRFGNAGEPVDEHGMVRKEEPPGNSGLRILDSSDCFKISLQHDQQPAAPDLQCTIFYQGQPVGQIPVTQKKANSSLLILKKSSLPEGVLKVEMRSSEELPISTYIVNRTDKLHLSVLTDQAKYDTRSPVRISLRLDGTLPDTAWASLSLSVFPLPEDYPLNEPDPISAWFGRNSELAPGTQLRRDEIWIYDALKEYQLKYPIESRGHIISGKVVDKKTEVAVDGALVFLSFSDTLSYLDYDRSDSTGSFFFSIPPYLNCDPVILQIWEAATGADNCRIEFEQPEILPPPCSVTPVGISSEELTGIFASQVKVFEIGSLFSGPAPPPVVNGITPSGYRFESIYGGYSHTIYPADFLRLNNFAEIVREILPGVKLKNEKEGITIRIMDESRNIYFDDDPLVLVNGMPLKNFNSLANLSSEDIVKIDMVRRLFAVGSMIFPGVLSVELKEKLSTEQLSDKRLYRISNRIITHVPAPGYPQYDTDTRKNNRRPDLRNTLFWLPELRMDTPEKEISFYTSDVPGMYRIRVEGLMNGSIPVSAVSEFRVETNF